MISQIATKQEFASNRYNLYLKTAREFQISNSLASYNWFKSFTRRKNIVLYAFWPSSTLNYFSISFTFPVISNPYEELQNTEYHIIIFSLAYLRSSPKLPDIFRE